MNLRYFLLPALLLALPLAARAQTPGVGIGTTAPDASAALDIVSSSKGALLPRVASAAALASPATGLIVFQTTTPAGFYYNAGTPAAPSWQQLATAAGTVATASNGLTRTGQDIALGGPLTQNTTLSLNNNSLELSGAPVAQQVTQLTENTVATTTVGGGISQSFTLPAGATIRQVDLYGQGSGTFRLFSGVPGRTELAAQAVSYAGTSTVTTVVLNTPVTVAAAGTYSFQSGSSGQFAANNNNPYGGGTAYVGTGSVAYLDLKFVVYYTTPNGTALYASSTSGVGVGTNAPTATLDVAGSTRLRGLSTAGLVSTDASGNLSSANPGGTFVLNQGATDQAGSFRLTGPGTLGGLLVNDHPAIGSSGAHLQWNRSGTAGETWLLNQMGGGNANAGIRFGKSDAANNVTEFGRFQDNGNFGLGDFGATSSVPLSRLSISPGLTEAKITLFDGGNLTSHYGLGVSNGQLNYHVMTTGDRHAFYATGRNGAGTELMRIQGDGRVGIGITAASGAPTATLDVNGSTRLRGLGAGVVQAAADGTLSSSSAAAAFGNTFIQNTTTSQAGANFNIGGSGTAGGTLTGAALQATTAAPIGTQGAHLQWNRSGGDGATWLLNQRGLGGDNAGLRFGKSDQNNTVTEFARFVESGNFGVGDFSGGSTPAPTATLDVNGTARVRTMGAGVVSADANGTLSSASAAATFGSSFIQNQTVANQPGGFRVSGNGAVGGNLGIGTATPSNRLDLGITYGTSPTDAAAKKLAVFNSTAGSDFYGLGVSPGYLHLFAGAAPTAAPALSIGSTGNVGIGTATPGALLDVNGNVRVPGTSAYTYASPKTYSVFYGASDFQPETSNVYGTGNGAIVANTNNEKVSINGSSANEGFFVRANYGTLRAPVHLPQGAVVTSMTIYYYDASSTLISVGLLKRTPSATGAGSLDALRDVDSVGNSGFGSATDGGTTLIDNNGSYYIAASFYAASGALYLTGVRLTYTVGQAE